MSITKTQLKRALVDERKSMREKHRESKVMQKTANTYRHMAERAREMGDMPELPFTLEEFRFWWKQQQLCHYCRCVLRLSNIAVDHAYPVGRDDSQNDCWQLDNLRACCKSCNWQKGMLDIEQFKDLSLWMQEHLKEPELSDMKRRLTIGGKWGWR